MYRFLIRTLMNGVSALLVAAVLLGGGLVMRLAWGPISLDSIAPSVERALNARLAAEAPGWRVDLGGGAIRFDQTASRLAVRFADVALVGPGGERVAQAPEVGLRVDALRVLRGELALTGAELIGARALLHRTEDGYFRFALQTTGADQEDARQGAADRAAADPVAAAGAEALRTAPVTAAMAAPTAEADAANVSDETPGPDEPPAPDGAPALGGAFAAIAQMTEGLGGDRDAPALLQQFDRLVVRDLDLSYDDALGGVFWRAADADLTIDRMPDGVSARLDAVIDTGGGVDAPDAIAVSISGARQVGSGVVDVEARFDRGDPALLATQIPDLAGLAALEAPIDGVVRAQLDLASGDLVGASVRLEAADGRVRLSPGAFAPFDQLLTEFDFFADDDRLALRTLSIDAPGVQLVAHGELGFARGGPDGLTVIGADGVLDFGPSVLAPEGVFATPLRLSDGRIAFRVDAADPQGGARLVIDSAGLAIGSVTLEGAGGARLLDGAVADVDFDVTATGVRAESLTALWPLAAAPGARLWVDRHIQSGRLDQVSARGRVPGGETPPEMTIAFRYSDLESTYLGEMPPIQDAHGAGLVTLERFDLGMASGHVDLGEGGRIELGGSTFAIPDLRTKPDGGPPDGEIDIRGQGPVRAVLSLIDSPPLGFVRRIGLDPAETSGEAVVRAQLALPLAKALTLPEVSVDTQATLTDLRLTVPRIGAEVAFPEAELTADTRTLRLTGPTRIQGAPLRLDWRETFAPADGAPRSRARATGRLTARQIERLGAPETLALEGRADFAADVRFVDGRAPAFTLDADLDRLGFAIAPLGYAKPERAEGRLQAEGSMRGAGLRFTRVQLDAPDLALDGSAQLDGGGGLRRLDLDSARHGRTAISATAEPSENGVLTVDIRGDRLDLTPFTEGLGGGGGGLGGDTGPIWISADVARLDVTDTLSLRNAEASVRVAGDGAIRAEAAGGLRDGRLSALYEPASGGQRLRVDATDAGDLMRALDLVKDAEGGALTLDARVAGPNRVIGSFSIEDVVIRNAPVLAEILSVATVFGAFDLIASGGISFSRVRGDFSLDGPRLRIQDAAAVGPSLGMSMDGVIRRDTGALDLAGSVSPAYALQGLIGNVPLLGDILTGGGRGEGVVGVAYSVGGDAENPRVGVNPLSVLAPGPFRRIFTPDPGADPSETRPRPSLRRERDPF